MENTFLRRATEFLRDDEAFLAIVSPEPVSYHLERPGSSGALYDRLVQLRGTPGSGQVDWDTTFDALGEIGYDGWVVIEAFGDSLPDLAAATKVWRRTFSSEEQLARDGASFLRPRLQRLASSAAQ